MTDPAGPQRPAPPSSPPSAPQGWSGGTRREHAGTGDGVEAPVLAPREQALIDEAVAPVGRRGRGPVIAAGFIIAAFLLGLVRPWDLLVSPNGGPGPSGPPASAVADTVAGPTIVPAPSTTPTCESPLTWRSATLETWNGRLARVWRAAEVVAASGPDDPALAFEPVVAATISAIGWCAPTDGPDRPPLASTATVYRIQDGAAVPVAYDRLEPAAPDAMGELLVPRPQGVGNRPTWPLGRYVIELRSASGTYVRYLGLELTDRVIRAPAVPDGATPEPSPSP